MCPNSENQYQLRILPIAASYLQNDKKIIIITDVSDAGYNIPPDTFPTVATDSINASKAGNGDFPRKYVAEASVVPPFNANSWGQL